MKKPHLMNMDELLSLPVIVGKETLDRTESFGGCFRDRRGVLWGTCFFDNIWARYQAVQLAGRAGLSVSALSEFSTLRGFIDVCDGVRIEGWAQDQAHPDTPVRVDVIVDSKFAARTYADQFRSDLLSADIGDGRHAFSLLLPTPLSRDVSHLVVLQRSADGIFLDVALVVAEQAAA